MRKAYMSWNETIPSLFSNEWFNFVRLLLYRTMMNSSTESLSTTLRLEGDGDEVDPWSIRLIDRSYIKALSIQVRSILLHEENAGGKMEIGAFKDKFQKRLIPPQNFIALWYTIKFFSYFSSVTTLR